MAAIPDDKVQEVRDKVDIADLVSRYVELRRAGRNLKGLCPFHPEKTPSFNVNPQRKGYKCFGCGAGGDAIRFVMDIEGKSFPEAIRKLAELYGVSLPADVGGGASPGKEHAKDQAYAAMRLATELYESILHERPEGEAGRNYLRTRGLTPDIARTFRLGYAPAPSEAGWDTLTRALERAKMSLSVAQELGLVGRSDRSGNQYDKFRGRLMFPVIAPGGEVVAFSGRIVPPHDEDAGDHPPPKYVNSSESILYTKGKQLFGLATARPAIRQSKRALVVEGNIDVVKLHQWGYGETVAPLGTALTPDQARLLGRFAEQVVLCFDGDTAGKKAAWSALPLLLEADLDVRMVLLPEGEDPDSVGQERFAALLGHASGALEEMMLRIAAKAGNASHALARGLDRLVPLIARVPRESARELYADRAATLFKVPAQRVTSAVRAARTANETSNTSGGRPSRDGASPRSSQENSRDINSISRQPVPSSAAVRSLPPLPAGQAQLAMLLVDVPHLALVAERAGVLDCVTDPRLRPIVQAVIDGAKHGAEPTMSELLELVDEAEQRQVYQAVFAGRYRPDDDGSDDPQSILHTLLQRSREQALEADISALDQAIAAAQRQGFPDKASELAQQRLDLRRRQATLRARAVAPAPTPSAHNS